MTEENKNQEEKNEENKTEGSGKINAMAILSYLWILFLVPLLAAKDDDFAQFHAKQGLVLFIVGIIGMFIGAIPFLGWILAPLVSLFCLILAIIGLINVFKGEKKELPLIGQYAKNLKI